MGDGEKGTSTPEELAALINEVKREVLDLKSPGRQVSPLVVAIRKKTPGLVKMILEEGVDPANIGSSIGTTALHVAVDDGLVEDVALLLAKGADPNACSEQEGTPLHQAVWKGNEATVKLLLENGADPEFPRACAATVATQPQFSYPHTIL